MNINFIFTRSSIFFYSSYIKAKVTTFDDIWDAAQAFNEDYNVKSWIIHHDVIIQNNKIIFSQYLKTPNLELKLFQILHVTYVFRCQFHNLL